MGSALLVSLAATVSAWGVVAPSPASRAVASLKRTSHVVHMKDEEISFSFGDAADISTETMEAMVDEEREMTDKEKEIARLRAAEKFMKKDTGNAMCQTCGYKYKWEEGVSSGSSRIPAKTPWELVPESFACPNCRSPKAFFDAEQMEIAGFADNQAYGFGTNTWTESQKSTAIFGGLAAFAALLVGGYALN